MKRYQLKFIDESGIERKCELLGESEADIRSQFKRFGYFRDCYLTFLKCEQDEARERMLSAINGVMRRNQFCLN